VSDRSRFDDGKEPAIRPVSRRDFLKTGSVLVIGISLFGCGNEKIQKPAAGPVLSEPWSPDVYVSFDASGTAFIISHRSEMGQGIRTGLPAVLADEMDADWSRVKVEQATGNARYGNQNTDGSWSVRGFMRRMQEAGATVRLMLEQSAAQQWGVNASECKADFHTVVHVPTGRVLDYRDLVAGAAELPVPDPGQLTFKSPDQYRYIGKALPIVDLYDMTHGQAKYGADTRIPGMKYAAIARPPVVFGKVRRFNPDKAMAVAGVERVIEMPVPSAPVVFQALGGVAVIASNSWAALRGRDLLEIEWDEGANADYDSAEYRVKLQETTRKPGTPLRTQGDATAALAASANVLEAEYYAPHLAHASMEPPAAVADPRQRHAAGWRIRPQVEMRFHRRSRIPFQGNRVSCPGAVEPGRRYPARLLPRRQCSKPGCRIERRRRRGRVATPPGLPQHHVDFRSVDHAGRRHGGWHGCVEHALRHPEHQRPGGRRRSESADRLVALGLQHLSGFRCELLRRRNCPGAGNGPERQPAGPAGAGPHDRPG
jgi:hypothetical protein